MARKDTKPIKIDVSKDAYKRMEELKDRLHIKNMSDLIKHSLNLTNYLKTHMEQGYEVVIRNKKTGRKIELYKRW